MKRPASLRAAARAAAKRALPEKLRRALRRPWPRERIDVPVIELITVRGAWPPTVIFPVPYAFYPDEDDRQIVALDPYADRRPVVLPAVMLNDIPRGGIRPSGPIENEQGALVLESAKRLSHMLENPEIHRRATTTVDRHGIGSTIVAPMRIANYFHCLVDMLPRLYALERVGGEVELVFPDPMPRFADELFERVMREGFTIGRYPPDVLVRFDAVRLSPFTTIWGNGMMRPEIAAWLRERLLGRPLGRDLSLPPRRLHVSRASARWHRAANEDALVAALANYDVETVRTEDLSVAQQLELFAQAELIVGVHGAGLANMLTSDRASVVELSPSGVGSRFQLAYWSLARTCGHRYVAVPHPSERHREEFDVDIDRVCAAVELALDGSADSPMGAVVLPLGS